MGKRPSGRGLASKLSFTQHLSRLHSWFGFKPFNDPDDPDPEPTSCHVCDQLAPPITTTDTNITPNNNSKNRKGKSNNSFHTPGFSTEPLFPLTCRGPCDRTFHLQCVGLTTTPSNAHEWFCGDSACRSARLVLASVVGAPNAFGLHLCTVCFKDFSSSGEMESREKCMYCDFEVHGMCIPDRVKPGKWICGKSGCVEARRMEIAKKREGKLPPEKRFVVMEINPPIDDTVRNGNVPVRSVSVSVVADGSFDEDDEAHLIADQDFDPLSPKKKPLSAEMKSPPQTFAVEVSPDTPKKGDLNLEEDQGNSTLRRSKRPSRQVFTLQLKGSSSSEAVQTATVESESPYLQGSTRKSNLKRNTDVYDYADDEFQDDEDAIISKRPRNSSRRLSDEDIIFPEKAENAFVSKLNARKRRKDPHASHENGTSSDFAPIPKKRRGSTEVENDSQSVSQRGSIVMPSSDIEMPKTVDPQEVAIMKICVKVNDECFRNRKVSDTTLHELRLLIFNLKTDQSKNTTFTCLVHNLTSSGWQFLLRKQIDRLVLSSLERDLKHLLDYSHSMNPEAKRLKKKIIIQYLKFFGNIISATLNEKTVLAEHADLARIMEQKLTQPNASLAPLLEAKKGSAVEIHAGELLNSCRNCLDSWEKHRQRQEELEQEKQRKERELEMLREMDVGNQQQQKVSKSSSGYAPISPARFSGTPKMGPVAARRDSDPNQEKKNLFGISGRKRLYWHGGAGIVADVSVTVQIATFNPEAPAHQVSILHVVPDIQEKLAQFPKEESCLKAGQKKLIVEDTNSPVDNSPSESSDDKGDFNHLAYLTLREIDKAVS